MNTFLKRPTPEIGECLTSCLQRVAKANYVTPHDLWRLILQKGAHYPQSSMSTQLDIYPSSFIDIEKLVGMLKMEIGTIEALTFTSAYRKMGVPVKSINHSRILSNTIVQHRKFCPECIKENLYYKLIWQVKEIEFCPIHNIKLHSKCSNCGTLISIMPSNSEIGICPNCNFNLKESLPDSYNSTPENSRIIEDWSYLLDSTNSKAYPINTLTIEQSLAIRLLYLVQLYSNDLTQNEKTMLSSIMQIARNTKSKQTFIHLGTILHFIRKFSVNLHHYLSLEVPKEYTDTILGNKTRMIDNYTCMAPWCNHYKIPGSLERTPTSVKVLKSGTKQKYYMYCNDCGTEYSISENDNSLIERGNFISFAWNAVRNELSVDCRFTELSRKIGVPEDKLRRAIIFLATNNLVNRYLIPLALPFSYDPTILTSIKQHIEMGIPTKSIRKHLNLNYNEFLFYWLSCDIRIANIKSIRKRPDSPQKMNVRIILFENAINQLTLEKIPITIESVSRKLEIVPETLRYWGFLDKLKDYKVLQRENNDKQLEDNLIKKMEEVINDALFAGEKISSEKLYRILGVKRTVLVRRFPYLTQFIHSKLKATNKLLC